MTHTFNAVIKVTEKSKRLKMQVFAMVMFIIAIIIEMIYSQYYMLVLFAPLFYLFISYRNLKNKLVHLQNCQLIATFTADYVIISINPPVNDWIGNYLVHYENFNKIEILDNGEAKFILYNVHELTTNKIIKKKILKINFLEKDSIEFKNIFQQYIDIYINKRTNR
jgi:hypothetical protein